MFIGSNLTLHMFVMVDACLELWMHQYLNLAQNTSNEPCDKLLHFSVNPT